MNTSAEPLETKHSANRNIHVITHDRNGNMVLVPGPFGRNAALTSVAFLPILIYLCHHFRLEMVLWITAILFPLFAAGGFLAMHIGYAIFGTRALLDLKRRIILISWAKRASNMEIPFEHIASVQRLYAGVKGGTEAGTWHAYQVNLVLKDQSRYNLLDSGGVTQLDRIGEELAKYLQVPFDKHEGDRKQCPVLPERRR